MNEGLIVHTLKQFKLTDISKVWLALINISDTIKYSDYIAMNRVYPPPEETFVENEHGYLKYAVETSGQVNFIFNSILMFNDKDEMLCYSELDPQNLSTVDSWVVKISASYDTEDGSANYYIDYLAIYKDHARSTQQNLAEVHDNLNLDEAITVTQARRFAGTDITTRYIEQTVNTVSTTPYDAVERLVVPARQDEGQSTLIKRYVNKRTKVFKYQDLNDSMSVKAIDSTDNTTILPSKIVDAVSTGTLLTHFVPRLAATTLEFFNQGLSENQLTAEDFARSYRYGSIYVDQTSGAGFFLPIYKHTDEPTEAAAEGSASDTVRLPAYKELRGCAIIPNGINKKILLFKFTGLGDKRYDFKRIAPRYTPMAYTHIIQFMNGNALYWSKQQNYPTPIEENSTTVNESTGLENPWVYINGNTGIKTSDEQNTSFKLYYAELDNTKLTATNIYTSPSLSTVNMYLSRLEDKGPIEYTEFKNYCINTRDYIKGIFTAAEGSGILRSVPRNVISYRILLAASTAQMPGDTGYVITDWSNNLKTDTFDFKASQSGRWFVETSTEDHGGKELFDLEWDNLLQVYQESIQSATPVWNGFTNFINSHSGKSQSLYFPIGIDRGSPGELLLDELPAIPEVGMDVINPIVQENDASRKVLNQIGAGIKSQALTMTQEISEAINTYVCRELAPYEDANGQVAENIGIEMMPCDNGILEVREDNTAIYVSVIKYSGKANNRVFRQVINKELLNENNDLNPYFMVSYSNNIICYRMKLRNSSTAYTSFYDLTKENPFTPILSNADRFISTNIGDNTDQYHICTLYHGYGMLFETEFMENIPSECIYNRCKLKINGTESDITTETYGRKLIRREYFLPDD